MELMTSSRRRRRLLTRLLPAGLLGATLATAGLVATAAADSPSDARASFFGGNATTCAQAGITATNILFENSDDSASDGNVSGTVSAYTGQNPPGAAPFANDADMLNVTLLNPNVVIKGVVVKGGNGYNVYSSAVQNMISPFNNGGNVPNISHWFVCYDIGDPPPPPPPPPGPDGGIEVGGVTAERPSSAVAVIAVARFTG